MNAGKASRCRVGTPALAGFDGIAAAVRPIGRRNSRGIMIGGGGSCRCRPAARPSRRLRGVHLLAGRFIREPVAFAVLAGWLIAQ
ncbi:hypothetical protein [Amycolatopsis balhimycina]|uniref:hypothetical protein n=1 Tax=Amycolatopsis balhimycina TaxID=208443 RepID=UPI001B7FA15B|nr:hypothetical protein [Amycolatopsis balhimycina]